MERGRANRAVRRLSPVALAVLFAGILAVPLKLNVRGDVEHVALVPAPAAVPRGPSPGAPTESPRPAPAPVVVARPPGDQPILPPTGPVVPVSDADAAPGAPPDSRPAGLAANAAQVPVPTGGPTKGQVWAVVIGINDYPGDGSDLRSAVADAEDMASALHGYGVDGDHILVAEDVDATGRGILRTLDWLVQVAGPDDTAVLFYAGHARKLDQTTEAVVGSDGRVVPDWLMAQHLSGLQAHDGWIVMASCYGGGFTELLQPGRVLTAAAGADDLAYESASFGRSYLGEYLVRRGMLLGGSAGPTAQQAFDYAQRALQQEHPDRVLTEVDESTAPVSLDGAHRDHVPPPPPPPPPPSTEPPPPPPAPQPKTCVLLVFCEG
jgi:hypothetical protein